MSAHADLSFSDEEVVTIFLYGLMDKKTELKTIYTHAHHSWKAWFPKLPSYTVFVQRLNRISEVFPPLVPKTS